MHRKTNKIVIVAGPSGAGKTSIVNYLLERISRLEFSVSATTRKKRKNEKEGGNYYFLSTEEFRNKVEHGDFLEYEEVYEGLMYGTLKNEIERIWKGSNTPVLDIDVKGALNVKKNLEVSALFIFIHPGSLEILKQRLKNRGTESEETLRSRLRRANEELGYAGAFEKKIYNNSDLKTSGEQAVMLVKDYIENKN